MLLSDGAKRLAIFAFFDADGIVDDYIPYLLERVGRFCEKQVVVVNGTLTPESEEKIRPFAACVRYRPNEGYDITAYKEGFLAESGALEQYDEVLFYNQTIFGPVCPLDAMFAEMGKRDVDFWGLTRHRGAPQASWREDVVIPPHVQSFFFAVRGAMLHAQEFLCYWRELPPIHSYWDAVEKHEILFTKRFADQGYRWDTYVDTSALETFNDYPLMGCPVPLLRAGCPFFKRKSFLEGRLGYATVPQGDAVWPLYVYLRDESAYPLRLVAQNLMRTVPAACVTQAIGPCFDVDAHRATEIRFAAVLHIGSAALAEPLLAAAARLAPHAALFLLFADEALRGRFAPQTPDGAQVYVAGGPGPRTLFETLWPQVSGYPYLCYLTTEMPRLLEGKFVDATSFAGAVENLARPECVDILEKNPAFGVLLPPAPSHQETLRLGRQLSCGQDAAAALLRAAGLRMPPPDAPGLASRGGMFFARTRALESLTRMDWHSPALFEGLYPLWELLPPLAARAAGCMTGFAACVHRAFVELENHRAMMAAVEDLWHSEDCPRMDQLLFRMRQLLDFFAARRYQMTVEQAADRSRFGFRQRLFYCLQILLPPRAAARLLKRAEKRNGKA